ncbi:MAG TPA: hypothetical protein VNK04_09395 [Gemmataceae bacterium]|nr:hypothetical protein [Gemmataceae bacterium]
MQYELDLTDKPPEQCRFPPPSSDLFLPPLPSSDRRSKSAKAKAKARRKQARKARKRNRKRR